LETPFDPRHPPFERGVMLDDGRQDRRDIFLCLIEFAINHHDTIACLRCLDFERLESIRDPDQVRLNLRIRDNDLAPNGFSFPLNSFPDHAAQLVYFDMYEHRGSVAFSVTGGKRGICRPRDEWLAVPAAAQ